MTSKIKKAILLFILLQTVFILGFLLSKNVTYTKDKGTASYEFIGTVDPTVQTDGKIFYYRIKYPLQSIIDDRNYGKYVLRVDLTKLPAYYTQALTFKSGGEALITTQDTFIPVYKKINVDEQHNEISFDLPRINILSNPVWLQTNDPDGNYIYEAKIDKYESDLQYVTGYRILPNSVFKSDLFPDSNQNVYFRLFSYTPIPTDQLKNAGIELIPLYGPQLTLQKIDTLAPLKVVNNNLGNLFIYLIILTSVSFLIVLIRSKMSRIWQLISRGLKAILKIIKKVYNVSLNKLGTIPIVYFFPMIIGVTIGLIADIVFVREPVTQNVLIIVVCLLILMYKFRLSYQYALGLATLFLILTTVTTIFGLNEITQKTGMWTYIFLFISILSFFFKINNPLPIAKFFKKKSHQ